MNKAYYIALAKEWEKVTTETRGALITKPMHAYLFPRMLREFEGDHLPVSGECCWYWFIASAGRRTEIEVVALTEEGFAKVEGIMQGVYFRNKDGGEPLLRCYGLSFRGELVGIGMSTEPNPSDCSKYV